MDIFALLFLIIFIWIIARICGRVFHGPRWRRRQTRNNFDYASWRISRDAARQAKRGW